MNNYYKEINHISWVITACIEQFRFVGNDLKRMQKLSIFYKLSSFNQGLKHYQVAVTLFKTAEKNWTLLIKNSRLNQSNIQNLYLLYIKRGTFQYKLFVDSIIKMNYETSLGQNALYFSLKEKINSLNKIVNQLDKSVFDITNYTF